MTLSPFLSSECPASIRESRARGKEHRQLENRLVGLKTNSLRVAACLRKVIHGVWPMTRVELFVEFVAVLGYDASFAKLTSQNLLGGFECL